MKRGSNSQVVCTIISFIVSVREGGAGEVVGAGESQGNRGGGP